MEFRPRNYDYHRKKPSYYQWEKSQRRKLIACIVVPIVVLALIVYVAVFLHR